MKYKCGFIQINYLVLLTEAPSIVWLPFVIEHIVCMDYGSSHQLPSYTTQSKYVSCSYVTQLNGHFVRHTLLAVGWSPSHSCSMIVNRTFIEQICQ